MSSPLDDLQRVYNVGLILEIDGLAIRYYAGRTTPGSEVVTSPYTARRGLYSYSPSEQKLDDLDLVVDGGGAHVEVLISNTNRAEQLMALTAPKTATLLQAVPKEAGAVDVFVAEDISDWDEEGVIYSGQEAMRYTSIDAMARSFGVVERAYLGTRLQLHRVDVLAGLLPQVTNTCVAWKGRPARIKVYRITAAGTWLGGVVDVEGIIDGSPQEPNGNGLIEIAIAPFTSVLRRSVGGASVTTTLSQYHAFDGVTAGTVSRSEYWEEGAAYNERLQAGSVGAATTTVETISWRPHEDVFDTAQADRVGPVLVGNSEAVTIDDGTYGGSADGGSFDVSSAVDYGPGTSVRNAATVLEQRVQLVTPGVPEALTLRDVLARINTAWSPGTNKGASGAWADAVITTSDADANGGPSIRFRVNSDHHAGPLIVKLFNNLQDNWTMLDFAQPGTLQVAGRPGRDGFLSHWDTQVARLASRKSRGDEDVLPIRGLSFAAWQPGEKWIWVDEIAGVFGTPDVSRAMYLLATYKEFSGRDVEALVRIADIYPADDVFPGLPGYLLETYEPERRQPRAIIWRLGDPAPVIRQAAVWVREPPTRILLDLLLSGDGDGVNNATYDRLPFGAGLDGNQVDIASFETFALPAGAVSSLTTDIRSAVEIATLARPWLQAARAALVDQVNPATGGRRLALVPMGPASSARSVLTINQRLWLQKPRPSSFVDDAIVNRLVASTNVDPRGIDSPVVTDLENASSVARHGAHERQETLVGVQLDDVTPGGRRAELLPWALETLVEHGRARRRIRGRLPYADGARLFCGADVELVDCPARGDDGIIGISGPARVSQLLRQPALGYVEVLLAFNAEDAHVRGIAPALKVTEVVSATKVKVDLEAWVDLVNPVTGEAQNALSFWGVDYPVQAVPRGNFAAHVNTTIAGIVGDEVELADPHGFTSRLGRLRPPPYHLAHASHQKYAFFAGDGGEIVAGVPGRRLG